MTRVEVGERQLQLSNLSKVLYPEPGFTKAEVVQYYVQIAPVMLPHLSNRGITFKRFPDGVEGESFFEKRCPSHRPDWVEIAPGPGDRGGDIGYCQLNEVAAIVWAANLAALELHVPMARATDIETPTMVVFDLDPGPPATITECCQVALDIAETLDAVSLRAWPKTSGGKGLQLYLPLNSPCDHETAKSFARAVAQLLEKQYPNRILSVMNKAARTGKVFIDWSQNSRHKTTIGVYSLRAQPHPTVSTPVTWDEVEAGASGARLHFVAGDVLARVGEVGDLFAPTATEVQHLPGS